MKEVPCVQCTGVSSHSSNTSRSERTVNSRQHGGEISAHVIPAIQQAGTALHAATFSKGLMLYLLCPFNSEVDFVTLEQCVVTPANMMQLLLALNVVQTLAF